MQTYKPMLLIVLTVPLCGPAESACAITFDYKTTAQALAEVGWHDYYGPYWDADFDSAEDTNDQSYASAYYDKIQYMGNVGISASAGASIEPNTVTLSTGLTGSYRFDVGWDLMDYFYQDANSTVEGLLQITEFPAGTPCSLHVNISFPKVRWSGLWTWGLYIESSLDYFLAGRDELFGDYGYPSGSITAYAGEQIYVFLWIAGRGYADHEVGEYLGYGPLSIEAALTATRHRADLRSDGRVDFQDFALLSGQWLQQGCENPDTDWCQRADIDLSGQVDANDLYLFSQYWLLLPIQIE